MATKKKTDVIEKTPPEKWKEVLQERGVKQSWLAEKTDISPEHISNILAGRVLLTDENKLKINEALGTNFK